MTDEPLARLYLDIDGVINANMPLGWGKTEEGFAFAQGQKYRIRWAPALIAALSELPVELVWTTTWRDDARLSFAELIGWGEHGRVLHPDLNPKAETTWPTIEWKMASVEMDQFASRSSYVHIDDEFVGQDLRIEDALVLGPNFQLGIQPKHIDQIHAFLDSLR